MHYSSPILLANVLGSHFANAGLCVLLSRCIKAKKLQSVSFYGADLGARKGYCFTPVGLNSFMSSFGSGALEPPKVRRNGGVVSLHDYGIGISLLQCMLLEKPLQYNREIVIGATGESYKSRGSICTDLLVTYPTESKSLYIEQDMGTENTWQLVKKIEDYENLGLLLPNTSLIFSSHSIFDDAIIPGYSIKNLEIIKSCVLQSGICDLKEFYMKYSVELEERARIVLESLLCIVGLAKGYYPGNRAISFRDYKQGCYIQFPSTDKTFSVDDLDQFIIHLKGGNNPYRTMIYNQHQEKVARGKFQNICELIYSQIVGQNYTAACVRVALRCYPLYVFPSMLLADRIQSHLLDEHRDYMFSFMKEYYPTLSIDSYKEIRPISFHDSYLPDMLCKNTFLTADGTLICFEHIGKDVGGFLRGAFLLYAVHMKAAVNYNKIHFVGIADNIQEIRSFCSLTEYYSLYSGMYNVIPSYLDVFTSFVYSYEFLPCNKLMAVLKGDCYFIEKPGFDVSSLSSSNLIDL